MHRTAVIFLFPPTLKHQLPHNGADYMDSRRLQPTGFNFGWRFAAFHAAATVLLATIVRTILFNRFSNPSATGWPEVIRMYAFGALTDLAVALILWAPLMAWLAIVPQKWISARWNRMLVLCGTWIGWVVLIFLGFAEYYFFEEYRSRFNTVAIDYLHYWTEVSENIGEMYPIRKIASVCIVNATSIAVLGVTLALSRDVASRRKRMRAAAVWLVVLCCAVGSVAMVGSRFSRDRLTNELATNGLVSGFVAMWTRDLEYPAFFPTMTRERAWVVARRALSTPEVTLAADPYSLQKHVKGDAARPQLNVILMLEESFGSEFWGSLTGKKEKSSLTPNLDRIASEEGMLFDRMLADGNRTIRGVEAILASFPPLPGDSIVARTRTREIETIAQVLKRDGYSTTFVYPGHGVFDGVGRFAKQNGFERFLEQKDFENPVFKTTWGVCNEDLYDRVLAEARSAHASGKPFLITSLSVSNHQPFTYPMGRIAAPPDRRSRKNAVRYVDYALGRFFALARQEQFWQNTVFVVVADHGARVYGSQTIPIGSYRIPFLVVGPAVVGAPQRISTPGCQLDVAPTILGLIGRPYETVFFGHDLMKVPLNQTRSMINHNRSIGLYRGERLIAFGLNKSIEIYQGTPWTDFTPTQEVDAESERLIEETTALFQVADEVYMREQYKVSSKEL